MGKVVTQSRLLDGALKVELTIGSLPTAGTRRGAWTVISRSSVEATRARLKRKALHMLVCLLSVRERSLSELSHLLSALIGWFKRKPCMVVLRQCVQFCRYANFAGFCLQ